MTSSVAHETVEQVFPLIDPDIGDRIMFILACIVTALSLFFLGAIKASFSSRR